ncbi:hypothetical protein [Deinococcus humi]|uniref:Uncharacterized protein n=1 Tax=Deinococcus humi TaxID=662880 RepID=A0A7W8JU59_9DEIO|nr:hypothetical protein [Deinococcus humi]MBB5363010.1 hypothetical protein [Deinococcus humi]GGO25156.1 hypothetical protein GCM10008949_14730 [Deinococcus humi]
MDLKTPGLIGEAAVLEQLDVAFSLDEPLARKRAVSQNYNTRRSRPQ